MDRVSSCELGARVKVVRDWTRSNVLLSNPSRSYTETYSTPACPADRVRVRTVWTNVRACCTLLRFYTSSIGEGKQNRRTSPIQSKCNRLPSSSRGKITLTCLGIRGKVPQRRQCCASSTWSCGSIVKGYHKQIWYRMCHARSASASGREKRSERMLPMPGRVGGDMMVIWEGVKVHSRCGFEIRLPWVLDKTALRSKLQQA